MNRCVCFLVGLFDRLCQLALPIEQSLQVLLFADEYSFEWGPCLLLFRICTALRPTGGLQWFASPVLGGEFVMTGSRSGLYI